ncbi:shikimate dehydrogenase [bacterium]|nr:shikimate dehydrogenase [bacterium]
MVYPTSNCWLLGHPVSHSLSPLIHNTAFNYLNLQLQYAALDVEGLEVGNAITQIDGKKVLGANVTIPHKQAVMPFLDELTEVAKRVGAVNTIYVEEGRRMGHNTDVEGFLSPLKTVGLEGAEMIVLGAGGAARAVLVALSYGLGAKQISLVSRDVDKAQRVCDELECGSPASYDQLAKLVERAGLVVNTTPVGMHPHVDESPIPDGIHFRAGQTVYDLIYAPRRTRLLKKAEREGATVIGGLPMLIAQAAASFKIWTQQEMPVEIVEAALQDHFEKA